MTAHNFEFYYQERFNYIGYHCKRCYLVKYIEYRDMKSKKNTEIVDFYYGFQMLVFNTYPVNDCDYFYNLLNKHKNETYNHKFIYDKLSHNRECIKCNQKSRLYLKGYSNIIDCNEYIMNEVLE